jgi:signal transduction histidine kinase
MYAEMLEQDWVSSPEKRQSYYGQIRQESERLSRLIENVLDFSRMQRGRKKFTLVAGDLNACLQQSVDTLVPYARQHGFSLQTVFADLPSLCFDRDAVSQIVVNLVDNAVKYAAAAEDKTIWIRTSVDARHVYIEVEDRGPGVPAAQRQKIFEQFYRMESEATRQTQGTGLGLALVMRFAEAHRGYVRLRAAHPLGAVFQVALARTG